MQKWPTYGQKCDFQYGGRRHLGFCKISILLVKMARGPHFLSLCQIWCESVQKWPRYCHLTDFKMATAAILDFLACVNFDGNSGCRTPFSAYVSNLVQIYTKMADLWPKVWFSIWRPRPSWILPDINFAGKTSYGTAFSISVSNLVWIHSKVAEL